MRPLDIEIGHDRISRRPEHAADQLTRGRDQAGTDQNIVTARAELDADAANAMDAIDPHCPARGGCRRPTAHGKGLAVWATASGASGPATSLARISATITSCAISRLSTVMSASA